MTSLVFPSSSFIGRSLPVEPFSFTVQQVSPMVVVLAQIVAIMLGHFVFMPYSGYMVVFSLYLYLRCISPFPAFSSKNNVGDYIYCYCVIQLYTYISIQVLCYLSIALIACLQHGGFTFFISIFYFCSLLRPLFFMIVVAVSLSFGFLRCKGMAVLSDTKHQAMPYSAKTFPECLPQMLHIWVFQKTFYRIVWCSDSQEPPFLNARKKAI